MNINDVGPHILRIYREFDLSGVVLMGVIGGTIARQRGFDIIGFFYIALFSALGGGIVRDLMIGNGPVAAISQPAYLILAMVGALIARFAYFKGKAWEIFQFHGDAVISGLWAATGTVKAITNGLPVLSCIFMGVITATGGSMIRDIATGEVPAVFGGNVPTAIPAIAGSSVLVVCNHFGHLGLGMILGPIVTIAILVVGYWTDWRISSRPEWAPLNVAAKIAEQKGRAVGRRVEPPRARAWRHRQMEKALQRRIERQVRKGAQRVDATRSADAIMDEFTEQFLDEPSKQTQAEVMDMILSDPDMTDELITRIDERRNLK